MSVATPPSRLPSLARARNNVVAYIPAKRTPSKWIRQITREMPISWLGQLLGIGIIKPLDGGIVVGDPGGTVTVKSPRAIVLYSCARRPRMICICDDMPKARPAVTPSENIEPDCTANSARRNIWLVVPDDNPEPGVANNLRRSSRLADEPRRLCEPAAANILLLRSKEDATPELRPDPLDAANDRLANVNDEAPVW